jgi:hypothetical protein
MHNHPEFAYSLLAGPSADVPKRQMALTRIFHLTFQRVSVSLLRENLIDDSIKRIKNGSEIVTKTTEAFGRVTTSAKKVSELVGEIAALRSQ